MNYYKEYITLGSLEVHLKDDLTQLGTVEG